MKALLLAAGEGTRLRPLTLSIPKCLVDIGGKPLLQHWLESLVTAGCFEEVIVNTHYLAERVNDFFESYHSPIPITLSHEPTLLGPGGTLMRHRSALMDGDFLVAHADNFTVVDWRGFLKAHHNRPDRCVGTMMTFETDDPSACGIVETNIDGTLITMHEKAANPPGTLANAAVFLFSPRVFEIIDRSVTKPVVDISCDIVPRLQGRLATFENILYHRDIGTPAALAKALDDYQQIVSVSRDRTS